MNKNVFINYNHENHENCTCFQSILRYIYSFILNIKRRCKAYKSLACNQYQKIFDVFISKPNRTEQKQLFYHLQQFALLFL